MKQISEMTQKHAAQPEVEDDEIDLMALAGALLAGWKWIALAFVVAVILGAFIALRKPVIYQATGLLQLEQSQNGLSALPESMQTLLGSDGGGKSQAETQIAIMSSRLVLGEAANKLNLQNFVIPRRLPVIGLLPANLHLPDPGLFDQYQWRSETVQLGRLKVPAQWQGVPMTLTVTGAGFASTQVFLLSALLGTSKAEFRGRVMSLRSLAIYAFAFGSMTSGAMAGLWSAPKAGYVVGTMGIVMALLLAVVAPKLRRL